jgi:hypothetical protein
MTIEQNSPAVAGHVERRVIQHNYGHDEGGYALCKNCGAAKHIREFEGYRFWFAGAGYEQEPECF